YDMNKDIIKELVGEGIILSEGDVHKRQRKMMSPSFSFTNVKEMTPTFVQAGHNLKDIWMKEIGNKKEERITITAVISKITLDVIGLSELSKAYKVVTSRNHTPLFIALSSLLPFIRKFPTPDNNKYYDSLKIISNISEKLLDNQKNNPVRGTDLFSLLAKANDTLPVDEQLTRYELINQLRNEILDIFPDRDYHPTFDQIEQLKFLDCVFKE
ncbi:5274_t:CDS:2, partial [Racocetra fulgida]